MVWRLNPATAKSIDLREAKAGDFLCSLRPSASADLWLKLAGDAMPCPMLNLTGVNQMVVWNVDSAVALPTLLFAQGPALELEIAENKGPAHYEGKVGELVIADSGAYFIANIRNRGFSEECCISLSDWKLVGLSAVGNIRAAFSTWRLVDARLPIDRQVVVSFGDWT